MKTKLQAGQIVRVKKYWKREGEADAYFIVIITEDRKGNCWLQAINSSRMYKAGTSICIIDFNEFEIVTPLAKNILHQEVTIKEEKYYDDVTDIVYQVDYPEKEIVYNKTSKGFISNVTYFMEYTICNGKLYAEIPDILLP